MFVQVLVIKHQVDYDLYRKRVADYVRVGYQIELFNYCVDLAALMHILSLCAAQRVLPLNDVI